MPTEEEQTMKGLLSSWGLGAKPCDACNSSPALLFCRPDAAFLCGPCDATIHSANPLASRHDRVLLCEVCEQSPSSVTCKADAASLCSSCDRDIHSANPLARRHQRLPVLPFFHTPPSDDHHHHQLSDKSSSSDESWLIPNLQGKLPDPEFVFASDINDSFVDSGASTEFDFKNQIRSYDSLVPSQTKTPQPFNLNSSYSESCFEIDFTQSKFNFSTQSVSSSDVGIVPDGASNSISEVSNFQLTGGGGGVTEGGLAAVQLSRVDRVARVMRYREKRKSRKFEKTIRYASRKAYAETRPRIKGRFAKRADNEAEVDQIYGNSGVNGGFFIQDDMYGVVPSF